MAKKKAKKFQKPQVTFRLNAFDLQRIDAMGESQWRPRAEMLQWAVRFFLDYHDPQSPLAQRDPREQRQ